MNVGIIGSGRIGATAARLFTQVGHSVALSNSRGPDTLAGLVTELGPHARAMTAEDAARFGEIVFVAIPFGRYTALPADAFAGKIVVDAGNYYPEYGGHIPELDSGQTTSSELVAAHLPGARMVKAFNTLSFRLLASAGKLSLPLEERQALFVAGDDPEAKQVIAALIEQTGFGPVDTGGLADGGRRQQPGSPVYNREITVRQAHEALAAA